MTKGTKAAPPKPRTTPSKVPPTTMRTTSGASSVSKGKGGKR